MRLNWSNIGKGLTDVADAKTYVDRRRDLDKLGNDYRTVQGKGLRITNRENGDSQTVVIDPTAGADMDTIRQQYQDAGYAVDTVDNAYTARSGEGHDTGSYATEAEAETAGRRSNYGLGNRRADVYEHYGDVDMARGLRREVRNDQRQDSADERATQEHAVKMRLGETQAKTAENALKSRETLDFDLEAANGLGTPEERTQATIEAYRKFDPAKAAELEGVYSRNDLQRITLRQAQMTQEKNEAFAGGPLKMVEWYNKIDDGKTAKLVNVGNGLMEVHLLDEKNPDAPPQVLVSKATPEEMMNKLHSFTTPGAMMELAEKEHRIKLLDAQANQANSNAQESAAKAGLANRTDPNLRAGVAGLDDKRAYQQASLLTKQAAGLRKQAENSPNPQERAMLLGKADMLDEQATQVMSIGGGKEAAPPSDKVTVQYLNRGVEAVRSGKASLESVNAELSSRGMPTISPEDVGQQRGLAPKRKIGDSSKPSYPDLRAEQERKKREAKRGSAPAQDDPYAGNW